MKGSVARNDFLDQLRPLLWKGLIDKAIALLKEMPDRCAIPNRTGRFWTIVRVHSSKMDKAKQWLIENGQILEDDI
jgi:hypothetical protein